MLRGGGFHSLFDQVISIENLFLAWQNFLRGKKNRIDVQQYLPHIENTLFSLHTQLKNGTWRHGSYISFQVRDPKLRDIHKASVVDRIVHHAVVNVIEPIVDRTFIYDSWSCRKGKGTTRSIDRCHILLNRLSNHGTRMVWVLHCDIRKFFHSIDHEILLTILRQKLSDGRMLNLCKQIIDSFSPGLPLGNLTSQLFANVCMNALDHYVKEVLRIPVYLRYSDDLLFASRDRDELFEVLGRVELFLHQNRKLTLHPHKISLRPFHHGNDWLGAVLYPGYRVMRTKTKKRVLERVDGVIHEYMDNFAVFDQYRSTLASYAGLAGVCGERELAKYLAEVRRMVG